MLQCMSTTRNAISRWIFLSLIFQTFTTFVGKKHFGDLIENHPIFVLNRLRILKKLLSLLNLSDKHQLTSFFASGKTSTDVCFDLLSALMLMWIEFLG